MKRNLIRVITFFNLSCSMLYMGAQASSTFDRIYLKAGAGAMKFNKFKETGGDVDGYNKKAPKTSPIYNIGIGYRFSDAIRTDLNLQYAKLKYKADELKQNIKTTAAFVNGYYDINFHESIVPYLTAGVGIGKNKPGNLKEKGTLTRKGKATTNFIWNVGAGAQYNINKNFAIDLGYRYVDLGKAKTNDSSDPDLWVGGKQKIKGHQVIGALVYNF